MARRRFIEEIEKQGGFRLITGPPSEKPITIASSHFVLVESISELPKYNPEIVLIGTKVGDDAEIGRQLQFGTLQNGVRAVEELTKEFNLPKGLERFVNVIWYEFR